MRTRVRDPEERARLKTERAAARESMRQEARRGEPQVIAVEGARELVTIGPDDPIWQVDVVAFLEGAGIRCKGMIVRLIPPNTATDEQVAKVRESIADAAAIRVMPRRKAAVIVATEELPERGAHKRAREIVSQLVGESNTRDRAALQAFCEQVMSRVGL